RRYRTHLRLAYTRTERRNKGRAYCRSVRFHWSQTEDGLPAASHRQRREGVPFDWAGSCVSSSLERTSTAVHGRNQPSGGIRRRRLPPRDRQASCIRYRRRCVCGDVRAQFPGASVSQRGGVESLKGTRVSYQDEEQRLEGYLAASSLSRDLPGV